MPDRTFKIDAHPLHILSQLDPGLITNSQTQRPERLDADKPLLSLSEANYATTHTALLERHYNSLFLSTFPPKLRRMDDRAGAGSAGMVEGPDLDSAVFVRCLGRWRGRSVAAGSQRSRGFEEDEDMAGVNVDSHYAPVEVSCGYTTPTNDLDDGNAQESRASAYIEERRELMKRGDIWIVRWSSVREVVARGECELI